MAVQAERNIFRVWAVIIGLVSLSSAIEWLENITAKPSPSQLAWHAHEIGAMITWNLQTACVPKGHASSQECQKGSQSGPLFVPSLEFVKSWNPSKADADAWLAVAASFGAKYVVLVVDHMTGFSLWPTQAHNFSLAHTAWQGGDLVADFLASCQRRNISPGMFYSTHYNWFLGVNNYQVGWPRLYGGPSYTQAQYQDVVLAQLRELVGPGSRYGSAVTELWFDGGVNLNATPAVGPLVASLTGQSVVCHSCAGFSERGASEQGVGRGVGLGAGLGVGLRWMGNEMGTMPLPSWGAVQANLQPMAGTPLGEIYAPASCDTVLSEHYWFWQPEERGHLRSTCALVNAYLTCVGRAANLILNIAPDATGAVPAQDAAAYAALGEALQCLWKAPLQNTSNLIVYDASAGPPQSNGSVTWVLPTPILGKPCGPLSTCFNISLHLGEGLGATGQRIANWDIAGTFSSGAVLPLLVAVPSAARVGVGHKRIVTAGAMVSGEAVQLTEIHITVASAYRWVGDAPSAPSPLVLASVALFDWQHVPECVAQSCTLASY